MNERDYSAELYEKMRAEQEQYRNYLLGQRPEEILNHLRCLQWHCGDRSKQRGRHHKRIGSTAA